MIAFDKTDTPRAARRNVEQKFQGRAVSRGAAIGRIVSLHGKKRQFYRVNLTSDQTEREIRRFRAAVRLAKRQIRKLFLHDNETHAKSQVNIFETHFLILEDSSLISKIEEMISRKRVNAEWAVKVVTDGYLSIYKGFEDEHLRERQIDLQDVSERLLAALGGGEAANLKLDENSIVVAGELKPSTLVEMSGGSLSAIITESGGWTSHSFILARELGLPAVTGLKGFLRRVDTGDSVIVDGYTGQVILNPAPETLERYRTASKFVESELDDAEIPKGKPQTLDGRKITLLANLDIASGYQRAKRFGAEGIGLYRSEFLFNQNQGFPSEAEQIAAYRKIAAIAGRDGVRIRTFDLNFDRIEEETDEREKNPALGLRGIRLSLARKRIFRAQIRALLQAAHDNRIDIVLPMISDVAELRQTREIIEQEKNKLKRRGLNFGSPRVGAMIEVPAAALMAEEIAAEVDFLNLGTNDLVQYILAVDRDNELVADWFRTLHPAVLRIVKSVINAAENAGKELIVCGEMAGSPVYAAILVGLGATSLSMNVGSLPRIRRIVSNIAFEEAAQIVKSLENCRTAAEIERQINKEFSAHWGRFFPPEILPPR